jgi:uncharacterized membrane protein
MIKKTIALLCLSSLLLLSGCSTIGSLTGAAIAAKSGQNVLLGSLIGGVAGQVIGSTTGQVASGTIGQVLK